MTFGNWPNEVHSTEDQLKRIASAKSLKTTSISIDTEKMTGIFFGSGAKPYSTTLETCTCVDFIRRKLPCKHIYRLAFECRAISEDLFASADKYLQYTVQDAIAILENYSDDVQILIESILPPLSKDIVTQVTLDSKTQAVLSCPLLKFEPIGASDVMSDMRKKDIVAILDRLAIHPEGNLKKADLIPWCLNNIPNFSDELPKKYSVFCSPQFKKAIHKTYTYLRRKFDWEYYYIEVESDGMKEIRYPYGAKFEDVEIYISLDGSSKSRGNPNVCHFPNDEVTQLLTLYGHNRCLNGFDVTTQEDL